MMAFVALELKNMKSMGYITQEGRIVLPGSKEAVLSSQIGLLLLKIKADRYRRELEEAQIRREGPQFLGERGF
jgi:hypothetical protein